MTEKNYNPEQKQMKTGKRMEKVDRNLKKIDEKKIVETPKEEKIDAQKEEIKTGTKKAEVKKVKKSKAIIRGLNVPISSKQSFAICKFIKHKNPERAVRELEEILLHKKALPMKGEIPHRKGNIMSGRYPKNAIEAFVRLLKSLIANANEISNPIISEAHANFASRPYGRFGSVRKKRTNVTIVVTEIKKMENKK
jgi:ribosomal protein L22